MAGAGCSSAEQGFEAMMKGEEKVVAGSLVNKLQVKAAAIVPDSLKAKVHGKLVHKDQEHLRRA